MHNQEHKDKKVLQAKIDAIAEQWVNIVFAHLQEKKLATKKPINIHNKYEHAIQ